MNKLKISKTFMKRLRTKSEIKRIRNESEIPKIKRINMYFFGYEREKKGKNKKWPLVTNCPSTAFTCHTKRKKTWWRFHHHGGKAGLATWRHCTCCRNGINTFHALMCDEHAPLTFLNKKSIIQQFFLFLLRGK